MGSESKIQTKPASGSQRSACCLDRLDLWTAGPGPGPDWHVGKLNDTHGLKEIL
jgi:hypothetical protein